jgi:phosphate-selective porin OprO/OprP
MRCKPLFPTLAFTTMLLSGIAPVAQAASVDDSEIRLLRAEMSQMRRDMQQQIVTLKHQLAKSDATTTKGRMGQAAGHGRHTTHVADGNYDPNVQFGEQEPMKKVAPLSGVGTPPSDRGDTMSWKDFKAATASDEEVRVGGMIVGFPKGRFTVSSEDGAYGFSVGLAFHEDFGGFLGGGPRRGETNGDFNSLTENARRIRIPFTFRYKDWVANVTPDFGAGNVDGATTDQTLYEANLNYTGLHNTILTVGYFQPRVTEEDSESSNDFMMMERPNITNVVRNIAAGDARFSLGGMHYAKRWWIGAYFTGQSFGGRSGYTGPNQNQTNNPLGGTFRVAGRPFVSKDIDLHVGISAISSFRPATNSTTGARNYSAGGNPEVALTTTNLLGSGTMSNVDSVWAAGPELGLRWKKLVVKAEYYNIGVTRSLGAVDYAKGMGNVNLDGYYVAANYTLFGKGRAYNEKEGAFGAPGVEHEFDPKHGYWGALELTGRYSVSNFHDVAINGTAPGVNDGNQQTVWSGGLNWYPNRHFRVMLDFNHFMVSGNGTGGSIGVINGYGRDGNSLAARVQAAF